MFQGNAPGGRSLETRQNMSSIHAPSAQMDSDDSLKRRQILLTLIDLLAELGNDNTFNTDVALPRVAEGDLPTSLSEIGVDQFLKFEKRVNDLNREICGFANAVRQLGSSAGILCSAFKLRERLTKILFLFRENAASLYPHKIMRQPREVASQTNFIGRERDRPWRSQHAVLVKLDLGDNLEPDALPAQFENFAKDIVTFLGYLNEFAEFADLAVNQSMRSFEGDLKYWASCLTEYKSQFDSPAVQRYVYDLTTEIGDHFDNITRSLSMFTDVGIPTIWFHQQHAASNLLNLSTVATFFSSVTATTLQYSYNSNDTAFSVAVNAIWFSSLVFSIAAAVNSLLGLSWKQAMYRSPGYRVPWWVLIWIKRSPLVFLVMSVACFSVGLVFFAYSSGQGFVTSTTITVLTAITSFGLAAVSTWFLSERLIFVQHKGQKWLEEVISEATKHLENTRIARVTRIFLHWFRLSLGATRGYLKQLPSRFFRSQQPEFLPFAEPVQLHPSTLSPRTLPPLRPPVQDQESSASVPEVEASRSAFHVTTENLTASSVDGRSDGTTETGHSYARQRFVNAVRSVIMLQVVSRPPLRHKTYSVDSPVPEPAARSPSRFSDSGISVRGGRVTIAIDKLKGLVTSQELTTHQALVRHLQFSPNGRYLATSSWDRTSTIYRVGESFTTHRTLVHVRGFVDQIAWSPNSKLLLTRVTRAVKVWSEDGVCRKTIDRQATVQFIVWLPTGNAFLSIEGCNVMKLDVHGNVLDTHQIGQVGLTTAAITPDCSRLLGVGCAMASPSGLQPSRLTGAEKRMILYNMQTKTIECQTPFAKDIRGIAMAKKVQTVLISPENGAPQLWKLETVKDGSRRESAQAPRLYMKHAFPLESSVDVVGPSLFGGKDDQFVLCAKKNGGIHIWDRETAVPLHSIRPSNAHNFGGLTCIGWNYATDDPMMIATGSRDGKVRIYTTAPLDAVSEESSDVEKRTEGNGPTNGSDHSGS